MTIAFSIISDMFASFIALYDIAIHITTKTIYAKTVPFTDIIALISLYKILHIHTKTYQTAKFDIRCKRTQVADD
jgi:hypothetical protein